MIKLAILSAVIGSTLGVRFKVLVLVPVTFLGAGAVIATSLLHGSTLPETAWAAVIFATLLQLGYLGTLLLRGNVAPRERTTQISLLSNPRLKS